MADELIAIDPGATTGWALFRHRNLVGCGKVSGSRAAVGGLPIADEAVIERPVVRRGHPRADDLMKLGILAGQISAHYPHGRMVKPEEWKGQLPKDACWDRARRCLNADELSLVPQDHNVRDAVALGLWALGRFKKVGAF